MRKKLLYTILVAIGMISVLGYLTHNSDEPFSVISRNSLSPCTFESTRTNTKNQISSFINRHTCTVTAFDDNLGIIRLNTNLFDYPTTHDIVFKIKPENTKEWYHEQPHLSSIKEVNGTYPFGFTKIQSSNSQNFIFQIEFKTENDISDQAHSENQKITTLYVHDRESILNPLGFVQHATKKVLHTEDILIHFLYISAIGLFPLLSLIAYKGHTSFQTLFAFYTTLLLFSQLSTFSFLSIDVLASYSNKLEYILVALGGYLLYIRRSRIPEIIHTVNNPKKVVNTKTTWIIFLGVVLLYSALRWPYLSLDFSGSHAMKYSSYVEPALHIVKNQDITLYQKFYQSRFQTNPQGIFPKYHHLPLMEWGLAGMFKLFPDLPVELSTRIFTHTLGIGILLSAFLFLRKVLPLSVVFSVLILLAVNPIFNFATFVTVNDSLTMLFLFLALLYLHKYFEDKKSLYLLLSGLLFGIGNTVKVSLLLFLGPIIYILMFYLSKNRNEFISTGIIYGYVFFTFQIIFQRTLNHLPSRGLGEFGYFTIFVLLYLFIFKVLYSFKKKFEDTIAKLSTTNILIAIGLLLLIGTFLILSVARASAYIRVFVTDSQLLFQPKLYSILLSRIKGFLSHYIFYLSLASIVVYSILHFVKKAQFNKIFLAMLIGSIVYLIIASKVIYFHTYYMLIFMVTGIIGASLFLDLFTELFDEYKKYILALLIATMIPASYFYSTDYISRNRSGFKQVVEFIQKNIQRNEIMIDESGTPTYGIYTRKPYFIGYSSLYQDDLINYTRENGFSDTIQKYNIKYVLTYLNEPTYHMLGPIIYPKKPVPERCQRTDFILSSITDDSTCSAPIAKYLSDEEIQEIASHFTLIKQFGGYRIYMLN